MMKKILRADIELETIYEITPQMLKARGISYVLTDLDNTIADYDTPIPTDAMRGWIKGMQDANIAVAIVSNNNMARVKKFCAELDIPHFWKSGKPRVRAIDTALLKLGGVREEAVMIGDKRSTDVLCAKLAGILSIKVKSIKPRGFIWKK